MHPFDRKDSCKGEIPNEMSVVVRVGRRPEGQVMLKSLGLFPLGNQSFELKEANAKVLR